MTSDENSSTQNDMKLSINTRKNNGTLEIQISDSGPGITDDDLNKIFEPLYSTKIYGVGLGLSIVKQIIEQHGGSIEIKSIKGQGTSVNLILPIHQN